MHFQDKRKSIPIKLLEQTRYPADRLGQPGAEHLALKSLKGSVAALTVAVSFLSTPLR